MSKIEELNTFIEERERIRVKKETGSPWPWTEDPIFQKYKFCNIRREDDRTTRWIANNWRKNHADDPDLWFALVIARRTLNWPASMEGLGYPVPWNPDYFQFVMKARELEGVKSYDTAYQLLVQGRTGNKAEMMVKYILDPLWAARDFIRPYLGGPKRWFDDGQETLQSFFNRLSSFKYMGLFYTGQVIADLKYVQLKDAPDWDSFAVPGPGSERGLNRVLDRHFNTVWKKGEWDTAFQELRPKIRMTMHAQDLQNSLCEFDKYKRISLGEGRVRPYHHTG